ncbi:hypothetical protein ALC56_04623 [Trachymyrmex septentrionalis]|uniref:Uncharacterized protein n=1 Tax=Trachymyrmex septentrionalis TaxID=34720 RepID=A0A195FK35_9HYME|nr:hypothetical protein ALC56_04623 [Trachymyrmex septentrionalis]
MSDEFNTRHEVRQTIAAPAWMFLPRTPLRRGLTSVATRKSRNHAAKSTLGEMVPRFEDVEMISDQRRRCRQENSYRLWKCMRPAQVILQVAGEVCGTVMKDEERFLPRMKGSSIREARGAQKYIALTFLFDDVDENENMDIDVK